jgi:hypothetical protein
MKIVVIPWLGWTDALLAQSFRWARENYNNSSILRRNADICQQDMTIGLDDRGIYQFLSEPGNCALRAQANDAMAMLYRSMSMAGSNRGQNPIVELVPWRHCRFVYMNDGHEAWLDFDGTLIVPFNGMPNEEQKEVLAGALRTFYFEMLNRSGIYSSDASPDITIGLDPEISVYKVVSGKGRISEHIDAREIIGQRNCDLRVGTDGCDSIFEFRPEASADIDAVVDSVESCVKALAYKLVRHGYPRFFGLVGGGCSHSLGGHIHIGNERIKKLHQPDLRKLGQMLDDFLYHPIRDRMAGALRAWINLRGISQQSFGGPIPHFDHLEDAKESLKGIRRFGRNLNFAGYDHPSQWRQKSYGYEYRSLPSFIVNKEFTHCVLSMAQIIVQKFWGLCTNGEEFEYNSPASMKDYLLLFPKDLARAFFRYINGDKREVFMDNLFENWGIKSGVYNKPVYVQQLCSGGWGSSLQLRDTDDLTEIGEKMSRRFHSLIRHAFRDGSEPAKIMFNSTVPSGAAFSVHHRGLVVHRPMPCGGAELDINALHAVPGCAVVLHGTGLRRGGMLHASKQALVMELFWKVGRTAPQRYEKICEIIRAWHPESEATYGPIITQDFSPLNRA